MVIDNQIYSRIANTWWTEDSVLCLLRMHVNPCRFAYFREVLSKRLAVDPRGCRVLDIGCGGGFLTEEFARLGCRVVGIDPSAESLEVARAHAAQGGQAIDYRQGFAEQLPFDDGEFDIVCCCDVLEHVRDLPAVIAETARVLRPGGPFFFDTINRTWTSWFFYIKVAQDWKSTAYMPPDLHDWKMFIRPAELRAQLLDHGLAVRDLVGFAPNIGPLKVLRELRKLKRRAITMGDYARQLKIVRTRDLSCAYMGYAVKPAVAV
jgi:2-polyprenyl-6-hydroxyphenyl methylase/3-demethylubiquinone-9 3-methyltransferase